MSNRPVEGSPQDYLVTDDVLMTLENRCGYEMTPEEKDAVQQAVSAALSGFEEVVPEGMEYQVVGGENLRNWAVNQLDSDTPVISVDNAYLPENGCSWLNIVELGMTRETNPETGEYELVTRKPERKYEDRLSEIASNFDEVQLFDVGAFTGGTMDMMQSDLENKGVEVTKTVAPVVNSEVINVESCISYKDSYNFGEWLEARDIAAIDGRKIPGRDNEDIPDRSFIPYWEDPQGMASIPNGDISQFKEISRELLADIQEILGEEVGNRVEANW